MPVCVNIIKILRYKYVNNINAGTLSLFEGEDYF